MLETQVDIGSALNPTIPAKGIEQAFISLYFLAKRRIAHTTNFEPLLDLLALLGVNYENYENLMYACIIMSMEFKGQIIWRGMLPLPYPPPGRQ